MRESDYILATNLAKLRIVERALRDVMFTGRTEALEGDRREAISLVRELIEACERTIRIQGGK